MPNLLLLRAFFPICGFGLLVCGLTGQVTPASGTFAPPTEERQPQRKPASCNPIQVALLRQQYRSYSFCRRHWHSANTARERDYWRLELRSAIEGYNEVAGDTNPSAFGSTALPRHL